MTQKRGKSKPRAQSKKLEPNFPPKLRLTYKDEDGHTVRILPTLPDPDPHTPLEYDPPYLPREY